MPGQGALEVTALPRGLNRRNGAPIEAALQGENSNESARRIERKLALNFIPQRSFSPLLVFLSSAKLHVLQAVLQSGEFGPCGSVRVCGGRMVTIGRASFCRRLPPANEGIPQAGQTRAAR
jgi:hypothetical protein